MTQTIVERRLAPPLNQPAPLLDVRGLTVATARGAELVQDITFSVTAGSSLGIVGESGSGKTMTAMAVAGLLPPTVAVTAGSIRVTGRDVTSRTDTERRELLRDTFGVVFQNPTVALNPRLTIGTQLREALSPEFGRNRSLARARSLELLDHVGVPRAAERLTAYPHELSGGLNQRIVIAMAVARRPKILIADEATTALDVSVQKQVLDLIDRLRAELDLAVLLVSHDMGVIADRTDDVLVLQDGKRVEQGPVVQVIAEPKHAYTRTLLDAVPRLDAAAPPQPPDDRPVLVEARDLVRTFPAHGQGHGVIRAVDHVDLTLRSGQALGVVGESGSGKTTLARILVGLDRPDQGRLNALGTPIRGATIARRRRQLRDVQYIFQDPWSALDPRQTVREIVAEPIRIAGTPDQRRQADRLVADLLEDVRLPVSYAERKPHQLSGGQRQRVVIARALALGPRVVVADEPVSALDLSVQATVLDLLTRLREEHDLSYIVISHDLAVVKQLCTDVIVMRDGRVVESGRTDDLFTAPTDPYTRLLLDAIPGRDRLHRAGYRSTS